MNLQLRGRKAATPWGSSHNAALHHPQCEHERAWVLYLKAAHKGTPIEQSVLSIDKASRHYQRGHKRLFSWPLQNDSFLWPHFVDLSHTDKRGRDSMIDALQEMLNGPTGRFDCAVLWAWLDEQRSE